MLILDLQMDSTEKLSEWLHGKPLSTQQAYLKDVSQLITFLHDKTLETITLRDLQRWQTELIELHTAPSTIARKTSAVRGFFRHCQRQGHIERNPAADLPAPPVHWRPHELAVDRETMLSIIATAAPGRDRALIKMLYATAARVSEICALRWRDCKPIASGGATIHLLGKRSKWRSTQLPPSVWAEVVELRGDAPSDAEVFGGLTRQQVGVIVKAAAIAAGAPEWFSPHKVRHCCASHSLEAGAPLVSVQRLLGHSRASTTLIYVHDTQEKSAIDYLEW